MRIARTFLAKILSALCSLLGLPLLFSCGEGSSIIKKTNIEQAAMYGMPPNYGRFSGQVYGKTGETKKLLSNVKIFSENENLTKSGEGYVFQTDEDGRFYIDLWEGGDYVFRFEDGDGSQNGSFKSFEKTIHYDEGNFITEDITLESEEDL